MIKGKSSPRLGGALGTPAPQRSIYLRIFGNYYPQSSVGILIAIDGHCSASLGRTSGGICKRPFATEGRYRSPRSFRGGGRVSAFIALGGDYGMAGLFLGRAFMFTVWGVRQRWQRTHRRCLA